MPECGRTLVGKNIKVKSSVRLLLLVLLLLLLASSPIGFAALRKSLHLHLIKWRCSELATLLHLHLLMKSSMAFISDWRVCTSYI